MIVQVVARREVPGGPTHPRVPAVVTIVMWTYRNGEPSRGPAWVAWRGEVVGRSWRGAVRAYE